MSLCLSHSFPPPLSSSFKKKYVFHFYMKGRVIARRGDRRRGLLSTGSLPNGCSGQSCVVSSLPSHAISTDVGQKCSSQTWASTHMGCRCRRYRVSLLGHGPGARIPFSLHFFPFDTCMCLPCLISQRCATGSMCLCKNGLVTGDWFQTSCVTPSSKESWQKPSWPAPVEQGWACSKQGSWVLMATDFIWTFLSWCV